MNPYILGGAVLAGMWLWSRFRGMGETGVTDSRTGLNSEDATVDINMRLDDYNDRSGLKHYFETQHEVGAYGTGLGFALGGPVGAAIGAIAGLVVGAIIHFVDKPPDDFGSAVRGVIRDELKALEKPHNSQWIDYCVVFLSMVGFRHHLYVNRKTGQPAFKLWVKGTNPSLRDLTAKADSRDAPLDVGNTYLGPAFSDGGAPSTVWRSTAGVIGSYDKLKKTINNQSAGTLFPMRIVTGHGSGKSLEDTIWTEKNTLLVDYAHPKKPGGDWQPMREQDIPTVMEWWVKTAGPAS